MELLRKLKKHASSRIGKDDNPPPLTRGRRPMREKAAPPMMDYGPLPRNFFNAVNSAREQEGYDALPIIPRGPIPSGDENLWYENPENDFPAFNRSRSKSRERSFDRSARPPSRGTPVKFRRRPVSPELLQPRASSPFLFRQQSLPASPDMHRHFQPQLFDMRMAHPVQFYPQFHPMMNPNIHVQPWFMMRQPQMFPLY
jgi:hypothetical protein